MQQDVLCLPAALGYWYAHLTLEAVVTRLASLATTPKCDETNADLHGWIDKEKDELFRTCTLILLLSVVM